MPTLFALLLAVLVACSSDTKPAETPATHPAPVAVAPIDAAPASVSVPVPMPVPDAAPAPTPAPTPSPPTADQAPKDLQVLPTSWSRKKLEDYMKTQVAAGLGVKCKHCHDTADFAKSTEHKEEARAMMRMTNDLNKQFFDGKSRVSCMTCHNGAPEPAKEE